jgi:hypothetical protein
LQQQNVKTKAATKYPLGLHVGKKVWWGDRHNGYSCTMALYKTFARMSEPAVEIIILKAH